jgi:hypothetical protein
VEDRVEILGRERAAIGGAEEPAARADECDGVLDEGREILWDAEGLGASSGRRAVAGEGGGIDDGGVEEAAFFREDLEPAECIAADEVVGGGSDIVMGEVAAGPVEIALGEIHGGSGGTGDGGDDGEGSGIGEEIEEGLAWGDGGGDAGAVVALVEEEAWGVAGGGVDLELGGAFLDEEGGGLWLAMEEGGGRFIALLEAAPVEGAAGWMAGGGADELCRGGGEIEGRQDPATGEVIEGEAWEAIGAGVDEAAGGGWRGQSERPPPFPAALEEVVGVSGGRIAGVTQGTVMILLVTGQ